MAYGYTRTLPTITGSHSDFPVLLTAGSFPTAAIDGGSNSIDNGGGNLRAYTDDTKATQLPLEVVAFVTGVSPYIQVWVKIPTAATGNTIYLEADDVAVSQPPVTDAYGRNSVWSGMSAYWHGNSLTDVTGNGSDLSLVGGASVDNIFNDSPWFSSSSNQGFEYSGGSETFGTNDVVWFTKWVRRISDNGSGSTNFQEAILDILNAGLSDNLALAIGSLSSLDNKLFAYTSGGNTQSSTGGSALSVGTDYRVDVVFDQPSNQIRFYVNGALDLTVNSYTDNSSGGQAGFIDVRSDSSGGIIGRSKDQGWATTEPTDNYLSTEYDNQNDPDNWGTSSAWESQDAALELTPTTINSASISLNPAIAFESLLNLSPTTVNSSSVSNNPDISYSSVLELAPQTVNSASLSLDPVIIYSGALNLSPNTVNSSSVSNNPIISYSSVLILTPETVNSNSVSLNPSIEYTSALVITPQTVNSASISIDPLIEFKSVINLNPDTVNSSSVSLNPIITTGEVQTIGNVTASFKDSGISVKYKLNGITVNFK